MTITTLLPLLILGFLFLASAIKILPEYERAVVFRLGRLIHVKGPGLIFIIPVIDKMIRVSVRTVAMDVPSQDVITKDNVSIKVNAVIYFRVMEANKAIIEVEDYLYAISQLAQTTLRSVMGESELDEVLSNRESINERLQAIIDESTDVWGVKVSMVELKHVDLPENMQRAMAKQAEAERERRAKIIAAEGEFQASEKLAAAAARIAVHPVAVQLRFLQTLTEIASDKNSTVLFPMPMELVEPFIKKKS